MLHTGRESLPNFSGGRAMSDLIISVRLSAGTYTARARGERATASSTISADAAARALAGKLGAVVIQPDLFAEARGNPDPHVQFTARRR